MPLHIFLHCVYCDFARRRSKAKQPLLIRGSRPATRRTKCGAFPSLPSVWILFPFPFAAYYYDLSEGRSRQDSYLALVWRLQHPFAFLQQERRGCSVSRVASEQSSARLCSGFETLTTKNLDSTQLLWKNSLDNNVSNFDSGEHDGVKGLTTRNAVSLSLHC